MGRENIEFFGHARSLGGVSAFLLYLLGVAGEILLLTSIYLVMPVGRLSLKHALIGGVTAGLLWELTRRVLVWYFSTLSQVKVVYGSLTTAIVVLLTLEIASLVLLLGAQVIAEYERFSHEQRERGAGAHAHLGQRAIRHPQIAVGIPDVGFPEAVRLVGGIGDDDVASCARRGNGRIGIAAMQPELDAGTARRHCANLVVQRMPLVGVIGVQHPFAAVAANDGEIGIRIDDGRTQARRAGRRATPPCRPRAG